MSFTAVSPSASSHRSSVDTMVVTSLVSEEGAAAACVAVSKNVGEGNGSTVPRPERLRHMHPDVAEFLLLSGTRRRRRKKRVLAVAEGAEKGGERVRYDCPFEDEGAPEEGRFAAPRLVWAKVKTHPWWPGQVFDPADASELALRHRRSRGAALLVAFFWDKTFAWADEEALHPFRDGFRRLAGSGQVASAVDAALVEVARRVDAGLSCGCIAARKQQVIENAGVRQGASGAAADAAFTRDAFRVEAFVAYVSALASAPLAGAERLDLAIAAAQLRAFTQWRGARRDLPESTATYGIVGIANGAMEVAAPTSRATSKKRRPRGGDDAPASASAGKWRMSRCARPAAADVAFTTDAFRGEAFVDYISASAVAPLAGTDRRDLVTATAHLKAFARWRGAPRGLPEHTVSYGIEEDIADGATPACRATATVKNGGDDAEADADALARKWRMSSCSRGSENVDDDALEMEEFDPSPQPSSHQMSMEMAKITSRADRSWVVGWKDYVIGMQFLLIFVLVCRLM